MSDKTTLKIFAGWTVFALLSPVFLIDVNFAIVNVYVIILSPIASIRILVRASNCGGAWSDLRVTPRTGTIWHKVGDIL